MRDFTSCRPSLDYLCHLIQLHAVRVVIASRHCLGDGGKRSLHMFGTCDSFLKDFYLCVCVHLCVCMSFVCVHVIYAYACHLCVCACMSFVCMHVIYVCTCHLCICACMSFMYMYVICVYVNVCHLCGCQRRTSDLSKLESQGFVSYPVWIMGAELWSPGRAVSFLSH